MPEIKKATLARPSNNGLSDEEYVYPITSADIVYYDEENNISVKDKIDEIIENMEGLTYAPISINTFKTNPSYLERGNIIKSINFSYKFNRIPKSIIIKIGDDEYDIDDVNSESHDINNLNITNSVNCSIIISDNKNNSTNKSISIPLQYRYFYGTSTEFNGIDNLVSELSNSKNMTIKVNAANNEYIYFCCPIHNISETTTFTVGGFSGGFTPVGLIYINTKYENNIFSYKSTEGIMEITNENIINTEEYTSDDTSIYTTHNTYILYKSDNANLGNITINIK